eukprot:8254314-Alexandrium_andersonii.AAC.1
MEGLREGERELQVLAEEAARELNATEDVPMDDAVIQDIEDFRGPEDPEDSELSEGSDGPRILAW